MASHEVTLDKIVALCKRRGFAYQSAEIYSGINGVYDFGPIGVQLRDNIKQLWKKNVSCWPEDTLFFDGAILEPAKAHGAIFSISFS